MIEPAYLYRATLVRVVDGDTYDLLIDLGFRASLRVPVRLRSWNCPEHNTADGVRASELAHQLLTSGPIVVRTYKDQQTFARWVADVWTDGMPLGDLLAAKGLAVPYVP